MANGNMRYLEIADELRSRVRTGKLRPDQKIASQNELATEFGVCAATIQKSLKELEREGLLRTHPGKGRFVTGPDARPRTWTLGVLLFDMDHLVHPVMSQRLAGISEAAAAAGYHLNILALNGSPAESAAADCEPPDLRWLLDSTAIDGAILLAQETAMESVYALAREVPTVWMDAPAIGENVVSVGLDYLGGGFAAAKHLIELGHRYIALAAPDPDRYWIAHQQYEGVRLAAQHAGEGALVEVVRLELDAYSAEDGEYAAHQLLSHPGTTAVICGSDEIALGCYRALAAAGRHVPEDVSLIAWNDTLTSDDLPVPLTTVRMDFRMSGVRSAQALLALIEAHATRPTPAPATADLVVRASTAPPAGAGPTKNVSEREITNGGIAQAN